MLEVTLVEHKKGKESDWKGLSQLNGELEKSLMLGKFCMGENGRPQVSAILSHWLGLAWKRVA